MDLLKRPANKYNYYEPKKTLYKSGILEPWGEHGAMRRNVTTATGTGSTAKDLIEEYIEKSSHAGVVEMLEAYPEMRISKFAEFPDHDVDYPIWLDELEEEEAEDIKNAIERIKPTKYVL